MSDQPDGRHVLFPNHYTWLVFVSAMDIMMTFLVLVSGGREANALASAIISRFGLPGMVLYKFAIIAFVIFLCETIGRKSINAGRKLAQIAVALSAIPVLLAFGLLLTRLHF